MTASVAPLRADLYPTLEGEVSGETVAAATYRQGRAAGQLWERVLETEGVEASAPLLHTPETIGHTLRGRYADEWPLYVDAPRRILISGVSLYRPAIVKYGIPAYRHVVVGVRPADERGGNWTMAMSIDEGIAALVRNIDYVGN